MVTLLGFWLVVKIAPGYITAILFGIAWLVLVGWLLKRFTRNRGHLRMPVWATFITLATLLVLLGAYSLLHGTTSHEKVPVGVKRTEVPPTASPPERGKRLPPRTIIEYAGKFGDGDEVSATGGAALLTMPDQSKKLTITDLDSNAGPWLHVYLAPGDGKDTSHAIDLGSLKATDGESQYDVPPSTDFASLHTVVIKSKVFGVKFGRAELKRQ